MLMMVLRGEGIALVASVLVAAVHTPIYAGASDNLPGLVNRYKRLVRVGLVDVVSV